MTKKRFTLKHYEDTDWAYDNGKSIYTKDMVELLNEQDETIQSLRLELDTHKHPLWSTREAERKVDELTGLLEEEVKKNGVLLEENNLLRIENMRLKEGYK